MGMVWEPLILIQPYRNDGTLPDMPSLPPSLSQRIEEGSRTLSIGLLVGEKLGLDLTSLSECMNEVWYAPLGEGRGLFTDLDLPTLLTGYTSIRDSLRAAIDDDGRPLGVGGERLKASTSIEQRSDGSLVTSSRNVSLIELLGDLDKLLKLLKFANDHDLYVSEGERPRREDLDQE